MKKLYLVDVSSFIFRAFYAIRTLSNPAGMPTNALYGFVSMTVKLIRDIHPDYMAFCFDTKAETFRKELDPRYKANRIEMPEDLVPQMPYFRRLSEAMGIPCLEQPGYEADDIIGSLTAIGEKHGLEVVIVSGDKDFAQLVRPHVSIYDTMKDLRIDEAGVFEKWQVKPDQFIDYLAIVGDTSDNVKGVSGVGPKGAVKLLAEFSSLDGIYENLDKISSASVRSKFAASREDAFLAKKLVTIVCDMKLDVAPEELKLRPIDRATLAALLTELDFKSFARTLLGNEVSLATETAVAAPETANMAETAVPAPETANAAARFIRKAAPITDWSINASGAASEASSPSSLSNPTVEALAPGEASSSVSSVQVNSINLGPIKEQRMSLAELHRWLMPRAETWAMQTERGVYLAQLNQGGPGYTVAELAADGRELASMLAEKNLKLKGFDLKNFARRLHLDRFSVAWDQMLAAYVLRAGQIQSLGEILAIYGEKLPELPSSAQILSAEIHLETTLRRRLHAANGDHVLFEIEQPLLPILLRMEEKGILIDSAVLAEQSAGLGKDMARLEKEIHALADEVFNIGSPKQLGLILFEKLKCPTGKKTKTGYSTDNEVLESLAKDFAIAGLVLQWRELSKLKSTYVDALPTLIDRETGRVHTTFNQAWTATGRLSSLNPNLQNIPIRTERGNMVRKAFVAPKGRMLLSADYSQIELRVLAHITGDPGLMRAFESGLDIHAATAAEIFEVNVKEVTPEMRRKAKAVNFGLAYGQGAFGLAETLRIPRAEASEIIARYFVRFAGVKTYMTDTVEEAKRRGYVETVFGRRRYLGELSSPSAMVRKFGERAAINAPIQGTASDLVKMAMIKVSQPEHAEMLLQVHDELIFEVDQAQLQAVTDEVVQKMEGAAVLKVPLKVNVGVGANWQDAH